MGEGTQRGGASMAAALVVALAVLGFGAPAAARWAEEEVLVVDLGGAFRAGRCRSYEVGGGELSRECPITFLGMGRLQARPVGPLLLRLQVGGGWFRLTDYALVHVLLPPEDVPDDVPWDTGVIEAQLGVGLAKQGEIAGGSFWVGPSVEARGVTPDTQARFEALGLRWTSTGEASAGLRLGAAFHLNLKESLRLALLIELDVQHPAGTAFTEDATGDDRAFVAVQKDYTDIRVLPGLEISAPATADQAFFARVQIAGGTREMGEDLHQFYVDAFGNDFGSRYDLLPELRLMLGVELRIEP